MKWTIYRIKYTSDNRLDSDIPHFFKKRYVQNLLCSIRSESFRRFDQDRAWRREDPSGFNRTIGGEGWDSRIQNFQITLDPRAHTLVSIRVTLRFSFSKIAHTVQKASFVSLIERRFISFTINIYHRTRTVRLRARVCIYIWVYVCVCGHIRASRVGSISRKLQITCRAMFPFAFPLLPAFAFDGD